jgi:hypothetical protein|tara:strand:+ start:765 stop:977 length:213 start_codon:yes stop_codon:yes gene_type:complete
VAGSYVLCREARAALAFTRSIWSVCSVELRPSTTVAALLTFGLAAIVVSRDAVLTATKALLLYVKLSLHA